MNDLAPPQPAPRSRATLVLLTALGLLAFAALIALGTWQVERRAWKLDLIDRVERRVHAPPLAAPGPPDWPGITAETNEYQHVRATGTFLNDKETLVQAVTELGGGFWVLSPLRTAEGTILVNRGFVPAEKRDPAARQADQQSGETVVTGLLRVTEPGGAMLRANDPAADRWFSRDVAAIATARGLDRSAPYFIDADATPNPGGHPVGGLTVIAFANNHLVYAITWYGLALLVAGGLAILFRENRRGRNSASTSSK